MTCKDNKEMKKNYTNYSQNICPKTPCRQKTTKTHSFRCLSIFMHGLKWSNGRQRLIFSYFVYGFINVRSMSIAMRSIEEPVSYCIARKHYIQDSEGWLWSILCSAGFRIIHSSMKFCNPRCQVCRKIRKTKRKHIFIILLYSYQRKSFQTTPSLYSILVNSIYWGSDNTNLDNLQVTTLIWGKGAFKSLPAGT